MSGHLSTISLARIGAERRPDEPKPHTAPGVQFIRPDRYRARYREKSLGYFASEALAAAAVAKERGLDMPALTGRSARMSLFEVTQDSTSKAA